MPIGPLKAKAVTQIVFLAKTSPKPNRGATHPQPHPIYRPPATRRSNMMVKMSSAFGALLSSPSGIKLAMVSWTYPDKSLASLISKAPVRLTPATTIQVSFQHPTKQYLLKLVTLLGLAKTHPAC